MLPPWRRPVRAGAMAGPQIVRARPGQERAVADLVAAAFHPLEIAGWLVPDPARRARILPPQFEILTAHAIRYGHIDLVADGAAAAVWFPMTGPLPAPASYDERLAAICGETTARFHLLDELFAEHHPTDPHHHLALLAVRPGAQRRGLGTALLRHHHRTLDGALLPAYLEASSAGSRALYLREGYRSEPPFRPPDGTPLWPMWREPVAAVAY